MTTLAAKTSRKKTRRKKSPASSPIKQRGQRRGPQAADLLAWYDRHRRALPWRARPGERSDPYRVWLSETML
jgi:A/G-specific adenine glycosylase